jgi:hypothetical protein
MVIPLSLACLSRDKNWKREEVNARMPAWGPALLPSVPMRELVPMRDTSSIVTANEAANRIAVERQIAQTTGACPCVARHLDGYAHAAATGAMSPDAAVTKSVALAGEDPLGGYN